MRRATLRPSAPRYTFDFDVTADLGPAFVLHGSGLDSRIAGELRVRHEGKGMVRASGTLNTRDGTYVGLRPEARDPPWPRACFRDRSTTPGSTSWRCAPACRSTSASASRAPRRTRWYGCTRTRRCPDFETLSWLVLGRQPEEGRGDNAALASAALGLLGGSGESMPTTIARRFGIDEFSIRAGTSESTISLLPRQAVAGRAAVRQQQ